MYTQRLGFKTGLLCTQTVSRHRERFMSGVRHGILPEIEHTRMQKSYKMAVFLCMVMDGDLPLLPH